VRLTVDGEPLEARAGESVAAALWAAGRRVLRRTGRRGEPRGLFCGMGVCFDCLMTIDGRRNVQACLMPVAEGMRVETQRGAGDGDPLP
jgi:aerobic-type carbon monoxide dehydrogenase small subunit (CoxS/CutS family)